MAINIDKQEFYVVVPQYGVNLVTNPHPKTTTGYVAYAGATRGLASALAAPYSAYSRRGADCLYFEPVASTLSGVYTSVELTAGTTYTIAADVLTTAGEPVSYLLWNTTAGTIGTLNYTASGYWERRSLTVTCGLTGTYNFIIARAASSANTYYVFTDGWQVESGTRATTFIVGDEPGFGEGDYYWSKEPYASSSVRSSLTRHGGYLLKISDYAGIESVPGLGMGTFNQIMTEMVSGGSLYQDHIRTARQFSIVLVFKGTDTRDLHTKRRTLIGALRPDNAGGGQPLILRYQGFDTNDVEATQPLDIECVLMSGLEDMPDLPTYHKDVLVFKIPDGHIKGAFKQGSGLETYQTLSQANYILKRSSAGAWSELGVDGLNGRVNCIAEAPNGYIFVGGAFTNAGGISGADYLAIYKPTTNAWGSAGVAVAGGAVRALAFDAAGDLYIGGSFTSVGGVANTRGVAKISTPTGIPAVTALGTGAGNNSVYALGVHPSGILYAGGDFTSMGGKADTGKVARYFFSTSAWGAVVTGLNATVRAIDFHISGGVYLGGDFTNAVSTGVGNYLCYYNGTAFSRVGPSYQPNGAVYALKYVTGVGLYVGGAFTAMTYGSNSMANSSYVVRWAGTTWTALSTGTNGAVWSFGYDKYSQRMYVGGGFTTAGPLTAVDRMAIWKGGAWSVIDVDLPTSAGNVISALFVSKTGMLYVGGIYTGAATTGKVATNFENNLGSANIYPKLVVTGPGTLKNIRNGTTGKLITFNGLTLNAGETISINLDPTELKMSSSWDGRVGLSSTIAAGSDHGEFYIAPGYNGIVLYMTNVTSATKAWIEWTPKYWSIDGAVNY